MRSFSLLALFLVTALLLPTDAHAQVPEVVAASRVNTSGRLDGMDPSSALYRQFPILIPNKFHSFGKVLEAEPIPGFADPVRDLGASLEALRAPAGVVLTDFEATPVGGSAPPDPSGDIGPNHYVQMVNSRSMIFDRAGTTLMGPFNNNQFWQGLGGQCELKNDGDPIVLYDEIADRWMVSQFALNPYAFCVAISATPDPLGAYHQYEFPWTQFLDYPKVGVWPDGYYVGFNTFDATTSSFLYSEYVALERDQMLQGLPANSIRFQSTTTSTPLPADVDGPVPPANLGGLFTAVNSNTIRVSELTPDWTTPLNSTLTQIATLPTQPFATRAGIPQPGTGDLLASLSSRGMFRLQYRNFGGQGRMLFNHTVEASGVAGVRWYELRDASTNTWTIYQQGTYAPADGLHRWMGSIAMNGAGDIGLGYSVSSGTVFPSIRFAGQTAANSGTGLLDIPETQIFAGSGSQTGTNGRWGDYTHLAIDPTNDATFWYTNQYYATTTSFAWRTRVSQFSFADLDPPVLAYSPGSLLFSLNTGDTDSKTVTFSNTAASGAADLAVNAALGSFTPLAPAEGDGPVVMARPVPLTEEEMSAFNAPSTQMPEAASAANPVSTQGPEASKMAVACTNGQQFDQLSANVPSVITAAGTLEVGQSFTAPCDGFLQTVSPVIAPTAANEGTPGSMTTRVYSGAGTAGTLLNATSSSFTNPATGFYFLNLVLSAPVEIVQGQQYTWFFDLTAGNTGVQHSTANPDAGGTRYVTLDGNPASAVSEANNDMRSRLTFLEPDVWATLSTGNISVAPGASATIDVNVDAAGLTAGTYTSTLSFTTNDADTPAGSIPVTLIVGGATMAESIDGGPGWRLFAPAAPGMTVADLGDLNRLSGIPGYDATSGFPNILTDYDGVTYSPPASGAEALTSGEGFWWYLYDINCYYDGAYDVTTAPNSCPGGDVNPSYALPFTLGTDMAPTTSDVTVDLNPLNTATTMMGNPFGQSLDISGISGWTGASNLASPAAVSYDSGTNSWNYSTTPPYDVISAWQGFLVYGNGTASTTLTIPETARTTGGVLRKTDDRVFLAFQLTEQSDAATPLADHGTVLYFDKNASAGDDAYDLAELTPADARYVSLAFGAETASGATVLRGHEGRSPEAGAFEIPMHVKAVGTASTMDLTWPTMDRIPADWSVKLRDLQTGAVIDLRDQTSYTFEVASGVVSAGAEFETPDFSAGVTALSAEGSAARFMLNVTPAIATSTTAEDGAVLSLSSPMPNPARERATLRFSLATAGEATIVVYDVQGREVARLAEGPHASGEHAVIWNTGAVAAGVYVIRLSTDDTVLTRRAVVVR